MTSCWPASKTPSPQRPHPRTCSTARSRGLAHHHGRWQRTPIPDLLIAETALHHGLGVLHVDGDYARISEVRSLTARRLG